MDNEMKCPCLIPQTDHCCDRIYHQGCIVFCSCEATVHPEWQNRQGWKQVACGNQFHSLLSEAAHVNLDLSKPMPNKKPKGFV